MRKQIKIITFLMLIGLITLGLSKNLVFASDNYYYDENDYAAYEEDTREYELDLGFGIEYVKTTAKSTAKRISPATSDRVDSPQVVNMVTIPSAGAVRIVNYTYPSDIGWSMQTLSNLVKQYEMHNPGWTVLAGINGDFYDINSGDKALPGHTSGPAVSDGDVLRTVNSKSVGFTNDGSDQTMIYSQGVTYSSNHVLTIYDKNKDIIKEYQVNKINSTPASGEIAVYYTYRYNVTVDGSLTYQEVTATVPGDNSYIVKFPIRCIPEHGTSVYGKGKIDAVNENMDLKYGQFAIVTDNPEIQQYLKDEDVTIRVQKEVTGDLASADQILGVGSTLMENGRISTDNSDGMRLNRHPRTTIGMKSDGSIMFFTVDGRQQSKGMYGMTQDELGVMMRCYGCVLGFNIDGGGSSTFGIRNENGNFVIMNTPSDGGERKVSNVLLAVVPTVKLKVDSIEDNNITFKYDDLAKGLTISNLKVTINDEIIKDMTSNKLTIDGLTKNTEYSYSYSYDITYNNMTSSIASKPSKFTTGYNKPIINQFTFDIINDSVRIKYNMTDSDNRLVFASIAYSGKVFFPDNQSGNKEIALSEFNDLVIKWIVEYDVGSNPNFTNRLEKVALWAPNDLDINNYYPEQQEEIKAILEEVNTKMEESTITEIKELIKDANKKISEIKTIEYIESYKEEKINDLNAYVSERKYKKKNQKIVDEILADAANKIRQSKSVKEINKLYDNALEEIKEIDTKGCKNNTIVIYSILASLGIIFVFKKKR